MAKLNKHGLKITGIKKAVSELKANLPKSNTYYSGIYMQVNYNVETGEVVTAYHYSLGHNSWTEYHDKNFILIGNYLKPLTMQRFCNDIAETVNDLQIQAIACGYDNKSHIGKATKKFCENTYIL